jgi:hypothetical protein
VKFLNHWYTNSISTDQKSHVNFSDLFKTVAPKIGSTMIPTIIKQHNDYVYNYFQIVEIINKQKYWNTPDELMIRKIITLNTKRGYKLKAYKLISAVIKYVHSYFLEFRHDVYTEFPAYITFFEFSRDFPKEFYKPDFLIKYIYLYLELIFLIKKVKPRKKLKKKKLQPKSLISYLPLRSRATITIRLINAYINRANIFYNVARLGDAILYLLFSGKNSFLYKKKISMYDKILEKKKFY